MQEYEYRIIAAPRRAKRAKGAKTSADKFAHTLTDIVNAEAEQGWEYMRADTLPADEKKGMLSSAIEVYQTVLVFRRRVKPKDEGRTQIREIRDSGVTPLRIRSDPDDARPSRTLGPAED